MKHACASQPHPFIAPFQCNCGSARSSNDNYVSLHRNPSATMADGYMRIVHFWCRRCPMNSVPTVSGRLIWALTLNFCDEDSLAASITYQIDHCISHNSDSHHCSQLYKYMYSASSNNHVLNVHRLAILVNVCKVVEYSASTINVHHLYMLYMELCNNRFICAIIEHTCIRACFCNL